jgi:hypothetical protein
MGHFLATMGSPFLEIKIIDVHNIKFEMAFPKDYWQVSPQRQVIHLLLYTNACSPRDNHGKI